MKRRGFTLVELAIVLVIIGIILGAVLKGKDLINSAKIKKFYNQYVQAWELQINTYYDRTGQVLGDGIVNGGTQANIDGYFDGINLANTTSVQDKLKAVGLDVPTSNTGNSGNYVLEGKYGRRQITSHLIIRYSHTEGTNYNTFYMQNMPTDIAIALDAIIDGDNNSSSGLFRRYPDNANGGIWPDASTTGAVNVMYIIK